MPTKSNRTTDPADDFADSLLKENPEPNFHLQTDLDRAVADLDVYVGQMLQAEQLKQQMNVQRRRLLARMSLLEGTELEDEFTRRGNEILVKHGVDPVLDDEPKTFPGAPDAKYLGDFDLFGKNGPRVELFHLG